MREFQGLAGVFCHVAVGIVLVGEGARLPECQLSLHAVRVARDDLRLTVAVIFVTLALHFAAFTWLITLK